MSLFTNKKTSVCRFVVWLFQRRWTTHWSCWLLLLLTYNYRKYSELIKCSSIVLVSESIRKLQNNFFVFVFPFYPNFLYEKFQKKHTNVLLITLPRSTICWKVWLIEDAAAFVPKHRQLSGRKIPHKVDRSASRRQSKHTSTIVKPTVLFLALVEPPNAEGFVNETVEILYWTLETTLLSS